MTCETCTHAVSEGDDLFCRANPPAVFLQPDGSLRSAFAPVKATWACGAWKAVKARRNANG